MASTITQTPLGMTLEQRLHQAPLPVPLVLRYALQLADALRRDHEQGVFRGLLDPANIVFGTDGAHFLPDDGGYLTPYVAPEILNEREPDARSDVFAFGALLYHLLSGHVPFPGANTEELRAAFDDCQPEPISSVVDGTTFVPVDAHPGIISLVTQCLEKNPEARWQRMQKVYMELKLLHVAARRVDKGAVTQRAATESRLREEISRVERSLTARVGACDQSVVELQRTASNSTEMLQTALAAQEAMRTAVATLEQTVNSVRDLALRLETGLEESTRTIAAVEESFSGQLAAVEEQLAAQGQSIESLHTTMSQTDDLLERVVESFDALQNFILEHSDERAAAAQA